MLCYFSISRICLSGEDGQHLHDGVGGRGAGIIKGTSSAATVNVPSSCACQTAKVSQMTQRGNQEDWSGSCEMPRTAGLLGDSKKDPGEFCAMQVKP